MGRLFGTDGIRGIANKELTAELATSVGAAVAEILSDNGKTPKVAVGGDTRRSTDMLISAVSAGLCSGGADAIVLGTVTTPETAYLAKRLEADAAIMISASHNPSEYNGIKIFSGSGYKLADELEDRIEELIREGKRSLKNVGRVKHAYGAEKEYIRYLAGTVNTRFDGIRVVLDCANGSASSTAPIVFSELGANVIAVNCEPDGGNINMNCGSTHMENLIMQVKMEKADIGFAFDGDADRCLCVDERGETVDGDEILAMCALDMKKDGKLKNGAVVGTVMTNFGFNEFCEKNSIDFKATKVGDRYVLEEMLMGGYNLGGEQSGHIIFTDHATTGDGILTALQVLSLVKRSGKPLSELKQVMKRAPQKLVNVKVSADGKVKYYTDQRIAEEIKKAEQKLGNTGRIVVRPSGTEPLIRVMVEGSDEKIINEIAINVSEIIKKQLV